MSLDQSIEMLKRGLAELHFADADFHNSNFMRLNSLKNMIKSRHLSTELRWLDG